MILPQTAADISDLAVGMGARRSQSSATTDEKIRQVAKIAVRYRAIGFISISIRIIDLKRHHGFWKLS